MDTNTSVGEIVKANFKTAQIFDKNKIDFCCNGGISLEEACKKSKVDINLCLTKHVSSSYAMVEESQLRVICCFGK